jgi:hypothetical protein
LIRSWRTFSCLSVGCIKQQTCAWDSGDDIEVRARAVGLSYSHAPLNYLSRIGHFLLMMVLTVASSAWSKHRPFSHFASMTPWILSYSEAPTAGLKIGLRKGRHYNSMMRLQSCTMNPSEIEGYDAYRVVVLLCDATFLSIQSSGIHHSCHHQRIPLLKHAPCDTFGSYDHSCPSSYIRHFFCLQ